jgi:hypothetical protein
MSVKLLRGAKKYVFFNVDYSKYRKVIFIKQKKEVSKCLHMCLNEVSTAGHRAKMFQHDGGKEFACEEVHHILSDCGITSLLSALYMPEQYRVAECEHHTVVELTWSMLSVCRLKYQ